MQLTKEQQLEAHEHQLVELKEAVKQAEELRKLTDSPLFRKVILQRFCVEECARYAQLSADPSLSPEQRADALGIAQAAGHLRRWISVMERMAKTAVDTIPQVEESLEIIRQTPEDELDGIEQH